MDAAWCPYQYPDELEDLRRWGLGEAVIRRQILDDVEADHCHPHYSVPEEVEIPPRDLLLVAADIRFDETGPTGFGYVVLSDGEPPRSRFFTEERNSLSTMTPRKRTRTRGH